MGPRAELPYVRRLMAARGFQKENSMNEREQEILKDVKEFIHDNRDNPLLVVAAGINGNDEANVSVQSIVRHHAETVDDVETVAMMLGVIDTMIDNIAEKEGRAGMCRVCIMHLSKRANCKVEVHTTLSNGKEEAE